MDKALRDGWVAALRSGEIAQTRQSLQDHDGYCCLGVLCLVANRMDPQQFPITHGSEGPKAGLILGGMLSHHRKLREILYDPERHVDYDADAKEIDCAGHLEEKAASLNDEGRSFAEIADWIEANVPITGQENSDEKVDTGTTGKVQGDDASQEEVSNWEGEGGAVKGP